MAKLIADVVDLAAAAEELRHAGIYLSKNDCPVSTEILLQLKYLERGAGVAVEQEIADESQFDGKRVEIEIKNPHHVFLVRIALEILKRDFQIIPIKETGAGAK